MKEDELKGMSKECVLEIFGSPNHHDPSGTTEVFIYFIGIGCVNNEYTADSDLIEVWITIKDNAIFKYSILKVVLTASEIHIQIHTIIPWPSKFNFHCILDFFFYLCLSE